MAKQFLVFILLLAAFSLSGCLTEGSVKQRVEEANYCSAKEDCVALNFPSVYCFLLADSLQPPFLVNKGEEAKISALLDEFCKPSESFVGMVGIIAYCDDPLLECQVGKCVGSCPQNEGEYCEKSRQCDLVPCFEGYAACEENKCACKAYVNGKVENSELEYLRNYLSLPPGWTMEENPAGDGIASFVFSSDEEICKHEVMGIPAEEPGVFFVIVFEEKWTEQDYADNNLALESFRQCRQNHPEYNPDAVSSAVSTAEIECKEESGLKDEPDFDTGNYSVYVSSNCQGVLLIDQIKADLQALD